MALPPRNPIPLYAEMNKYGYWVVTWSLVAGLRVDLTCAKVGISRSEAIEATRALLPFLPPALERLPWVT